MTMKVQSSVHPLNPDTILVRMSRDEACQLRDSMRAFWVNLALRTDLNDPPSDESYAPPTGDSPFAQLFVHLNNLLKK